MQVVLEGRAMLQNSMYKKCLTISIHEVAILVLVFLHGFDYPISK